MSKWNPFAPKDPDGVERPSKPVRHESHSELNKNGRTAKDQYDWDQAMLANSQSSNERKDPDQCMASRCRKTARSDQDFCNEHRNGRGL